MSEAEAGREVQCHHHQYLLLSVPSWFLTTADSALQTVLELLRTSDTHTHTTAHPTPDKQQNRRKKTRTTPHTHTHTHTHTQTHTHTGWGSLALNQKPPVGHFQLCLGIAFKQSELHRLAKYGQIGR